jgi:(p)ppGpp synthase/HD superfamily hydrolase
MSGLGAAIAFASKMHLTQLDKAGQPYILHPIRVMLKFDAEPQQIVSVLHDFEKNAM